MAAPRKSGFDGAGGGGGSGPQGGQNPPSAAPPSTAVHGEAIPVIYGTEQTGGRVVYKGQGPGAPKKLWKWTDANGWVTYDGYANQVILALCEAPIQAVVEARKGGGAPIYSEAFLTYLTAQGTTVTVQKALGGPALTGLATTAANGMGLEGTAYLRADWLGLADDRSVPDITFTIRGRCIGSDGRNADPAEVVLDLLTNPRYGVGLPASLVEVDHGIDRATASSYRTYCAAEGFLVSRAINDQSSAGDLLESLLVCTHSEPVWSDGKLFIVPERDTPIGAYRPNQWNESLGLIEAVQIDENELIKKDGEDPVTVTRARDAEVYNTWPVTIRNQDHNYETSEYEAEETSHSSVYGQRRASPVDLPWITKPELALKLSNLFALRSIYGRNEVRLKTKARWARLDPMDFIQLTVPEPGSTPRTVLCRIRKIKRTGDDDGSLEIVAREAPLGSSTPVDLTPQTEDGSADPLEPVFTGEVQAATDQAQGAADAAQVQGENIVVNGNSEISGLSGPAGDGIEEVAGQGYGGSSRYRVLTHDGVNPQAAYILVDYPAVPGDTFEYGGMVYGSPGHVGLRFTSEDGSNACYSTTADVGGASYQPSNGVFTVPASPVRTKLSLYIEAPPAAAGTKTRVDNIWCRRAMVGKAGTYSGLPAWLAWQAMDGSESSGYAFYRGNDQPGTRGGAPDINCLNIAPIGGLYNSATQFNELYYQAVIQPTVAVLPQTDNLDTLNTLIVKVYADTSQTSPMNTVYVPIHGRGYNASGADNNRIRIDFVVGNRRNGSSVGLTTPFLPMVYLRCSLQNTYGVSAEMDYGPAVSAGVAMARGQWLITGAGGGGSGGGGGGINPCPAPWVPIDLANGAQKQAKDIVPGDMVWTRGEDEGEYRAFPVEAVAPDFNDLWSLSVAPLDRPIDAFSLHFAGDHRFYVREKGLVELNALQPGDIIEGKRPAAVVAVAPAYHGEVVRITVAGGHTYETCGLWSHNAKQL